MRELKTILFALQLWKKSRKLHHKDFIRQQDSVEVCNEGRRNSFDTPTRPGHTNTTSDQSTQPESNISAHSRHAERPGRSPEPTEDPDIRVEASTEMVPHNPSQMGTSEVGRICCQAQYTDKDVLESQTGSSSSSHRCFQSILAQEGIISASSLETYSTGAPKISPTESQRSHIGNAILEDPVLIPNGTKTNKRITNDNADNEPLGFSRVAIITNHQQDHGLDPATVEYLQQGRRKRPIRYMIEAGHCGRHTNR